MPGILPDSTSASAVVYRDIDGNTLNPPDVVNAYSPPPTFVVDCPLTALPASCEARIEPRQINAIVSELIALAECFDPNGPWHCASVTNLCATFGTWKVGNVDSKVDIAGDTMTGQLILFGNPTDPLGAATKQMVDIKEDYTNKGQPNGYPSLDSSGKIPSVYLPAYVDDILEYPTSADFPTTGQSGVIYVALDTGKQYRWSGTQYNEVSPSDVNSVNGQTGIVVIDKASLGLGNVDNTSDANKPISTATAAALALKAPLNDAELTGSPSAPTRPLNDSSVGIANTTWIRLNYPKAELIGPAVDFNTITNPGTYATSNPSANPNEPTGAGQWYLHVLGFSTDANYVCQLAYTLTGSYSAWMRVRISGAWQGWTRLLNDTQIATTVEILNYTIGKLISVDQMWNAGMFVNVADAASVVLDFSTGFNFQWTLGAAGRTLENPINMKPAGGQSGLIYITPGASGTITGWGTAWKFPGGVKPQLTPGAVDVIAYTVRSSSLIVCTFMPDVR